VIHFAYFYVLWLSIEFAFKAPFLSKEVGWGGVGMLYAQSLVDPFGVLWFIYLLPVFFVVTKLTRRVSPLLIWLVGAGLQIANIHTGWSVADYFCARFVYFYSGYLAAAYVFRLAASAQQHPRKAVLALLVWATVNGWLVYTGAAIWPVVSLLLGFAGAFAVVSFSALMAKRDIFAPVRYCGEHSIVIYLAFFIPMATTRLILVENDIISDIGTMSVIITIVGVLGSVILYWLVRDTRFRFLFERPALFRLKSKPAAGLVVPGTDRSEAVS
jgi:uncharacterized membrane protein YcfT